MNNNSFETNDCNKDFINTMCKDVFFIFCFKLAVASELHRMSNKCKKLGWHWLSGFIEKISAPLKRSLADSFMTIRVRHYVYNMYKKEK